MSDLVVLAYADEHRAAEVLATLQRLRNGSIFEVLEAVCVVRRTDWTVILQQAVDLAVADDTSSRFWRGLISSLILTPGATPLRINVGEYGIEPGFERRLRGALPPGSSAVFLIVPAGGLRRLAPYLRDFGGTLAATPIELRGGQQRSALPSPGKMEHIDPGPQDKPDLARAMVTPKSLFTGGGSLPSK
jgi:uncharacterized membrane protein